MLFDTKVLIVDDEESIRTFCKAALLAEGFSVQTASDGEAGLNALAQDNYDLLLLDISMPGMDGLTVLEYVADQYTHISAIMMTGYATLEAAVRAQDLGAEGFLLKPFDDQKLIMAINRVLERRMLRQDYARLQTHLPLISLSHRLVTEQSLESLAESALEIARQETRATNIALWLAPDARIFLPSSETRLYESPVLLAHISQPPALPDPDVWPTPKSNIWFALDAQAASTTDINQANVLHILLQTEGHQVGVLSLSKDEGRYFNNNEMDFLLLAGSYLAVGLENRHLYEILNLARQKWEAVFNTIDDGLLIHHAHNGDITQVNQTMATWLNTTAEKLLQQPASKIDAGGQGCTFCQLAPPGKRQEEFNEKTFSSAEFASPSWALGKHFRVRTFSLYKPNAPVDQDNTTVEQTDEPVEIIHVLEDITQANKMQVQLLQAEKLSALGRLSASLAHEINNPLQALRSGLRLLGRPKLDDKKRQNYVAALVKEVERLIDTTTRALDFARPGRIGKKSADFNQLLQETLDLVSKQFQHSNIETSLELAPDLPAIQVVPDQIKQVFLNLILNAVDAMPNGGHLKLTSSHSPDDSFIVAILVDSGVGIPPEIMDKIYEPFFSTKETGTGLGLSISYSIIEAHGGLIEIDSQPNEGSRFTVYLPIDLEGDNGIT